MNKKPENLIYALQDNKIVHISEVESGLDCNCICPYCKELLVAKKGSKKIHHFSHYNAELCEHGYETAIHLAAKDMLLKSGELKLPPLYMKVNGSSYLRRYIDSSTIRFDKVISEKRINDIVPDIIVQCGSKKLLIEIIVTHDIDDEKLKKLKKIGISTIGIYLKKLDSIDDIRNSIVSEINNKKWIYNSYAIKFKEQILGLCKKINLNQEIKCPKSIYEYEKQLTKSKSDCEKCKFCFGIDDEKEYIYCYGKELISEHDDIKLTFEQRLKKYKVQYNVYPIDRKCPCCGSNLKLIRDKYGYTLYCEKYDEYDFDKEYFCMFKKNYSQEVLAMLKKDHCPNCGGMLKLRHNKNNHRQFLGCGNFPKCNYTEEADLGEPCPRCGGRLIIRNGKNGKFYGCKNYPRCKFTKVMKVDKSTDEIIE